jgi:hypothetical protein
VRRKRCGSALPHTNEKTRWPQTVYLQLRFKFDTLVVARLDAEHASSDGGMVLLKAVDRQLGVAEAVASCLRDRRCAYWGSSGRRCA